MVRKEVRTVHLCQNAPSKRLPGSHKLWAFGIKDLAVLMGKTEWAIRAAIFRGDLDPTDLRSICVYWAKRVKVR